MLFQMGCIARHISSQPSLRSHIVSCVSAPQYLLLWACSMYARKVMADQYINLEVDGLYYHSYLKVKVFSH